MSTNDGMGSDRNTVKLSLRIVMSLVPTRSNLYAEPAQY